MKKTQALRKPNTTRIYRTVTKKKKKIKYRRIILKISGEMLGTNQELFRLSAIDYITKQIIEVHSLGVKIGVVIGGGNIIRGRDASWLNKVDADISGMLATIINGIIIQSKLRKNDVSAKLSSGIEVSGIVRRCNRFEDMQFYESGGVLLFVGGTGNPLFTTDTAAALRAVEFEADILIKATKVKGVYSTDPVRSRKAKFYRKLKISEAIAKNLGVMDLAAFNICKESNLPICVYNLMKFPLSGIIKGKSIGTLITEGEKDD